MAKAKQGDLTEDTTTAQGAPQSKVKSEAEQLADQNREAVKQSENDKAVESAIAKTDLSLYTDFPGINAQKMNVLRNTICKDFNFLETCFFLNHCASINLNPFNKEVWAWKDKYGKIQSTAAEAGYRVNAERHPSYGGIEFGVIYEGDEFEFDYTNKDMPIIHKAKGIPKGKPTGAWAIVYRKGMPSIPIRVPFDEYYQANSNAWNKNPTDMIAKVARAKALSVQFPISGVIPEFEVTTKDGKPDYIDHMKGEETQEQLAEELLNNKIAEALEVYEMYEGADKVRIGEEIRLFQNKKTLTVEMLDDYIEHMQTKKK